MKKKYLFVFIMLLTILLGSMGLTTLYVASTDESDDEADITIVTSFYPIYIACLNITDGIDGVKLENLSEPQTGCLHDFQLTPEDLKLLSTADVFVINGGGIESFMEEVAAEQPELTILTATADVDLLAEDEEGAGDAEHADEENTAKDVVESVNENGTDSIIGYEGSDTVTGTTVGTEDDTIDGTDEDEHDHGDENVNAHAWMSISSYRVMIATIASGMAEADPDHADQYLANADEYDAKLAELQKEQEELVQEVTVPVIIFHAAYAYVAQDYNLEVVGMMDLDEERQISAGEVADIVDAVEEYGVTFILAEELYGSSMGEMVQKETDVEVLYLDPLTRGEYDKDSYLDAMRENIEILRSVLL